MDMATGERERQAVKGQSFRSCLEINRGELRFDEQILFCLREAGWRDGVCCCFFWSRIGWDER